MPSVCRVLEIVVYSLLNFLPFLGLAIYPFRRSLRFSRKITILLTVLLSVIQCLLGAWAAFSDGNVAGRVSAVSTLLYAAFYFLAVKKRVGKTLFTLLMISNIANFSVIAAKCLEGLAFPLLAAQRYRWSFSLMLLLVEAALAVPMFLYTKKIFTPAVEEEPSGFEWRYLWLIPATFYVVWYYAFYGNTTLTSLEIALKPKNTLFLLAINTGEILVYYVVTRLILEQKESLALKERNHQLTMQTMQYENLKEKITEARRVKHDVRHHIALMQDYLNQGDYAALKDYLKQYGESLPEDTPDCFCENKAANAVLSHFAQKAKANGILYRVDVRLAQDTGVPDTDLAVLLGNLLENAVDACRLEREGTRKIIVHANTDNRSLCLTVDSTYTGSLKRTKDGHLLSSKHKGVGLGTRSVESIAEQHGGICRFEAKDGMFYASVYFQIDE